MKEKNDAKINLKIDKELKEKFEKYCEKQGRSMSSQIKYWIKTIALGGGVKVEIFSHRRNYMLKINAWPMGGGPGIKKEAPIAEPLLMS